MKKIEKLLKSEVTQFGVYDPDSAVLANYSLNQNIEVENETT